MIGHFLLQSRLALIGFLLVGAMAAAADLSSYRTFKLGADLPSIAKETGTMASATVTHSRPALIQEIRWRPQSLEATRQPESAKDVVFSFIDGRLFRITVKYDSYDTEGLTAEDMIEAISATYGVSTSLLRAIGSSSPMASN
jgi:hypothetical protein